MGGRRILTRWSILKSTGFPLREEGKESERERERNEENEGEGGGESVRERDIERGWERGGGVPEVKDGLRFQGEEDGMPFADHFRTTIE